MASSISSFRVFALAALMVCTGAWINNQTPEPKHEIDHDRNVFWQRKVFDTKDHTYNVVASGDSRIYRGFDPQMIENALPGTRAYNFGFSSGGHNPFIFRHIENLLVDDARQPRAIILGITPFSLTPKTQENSAYTDTFKKGPAGWDDTINDYFRPLDQHRVKDLVHPRKTKPLDFHYDYLPNGWVRSDWDKRDITSELKSYRTDFNGNKVDPATIDGVMRQVQNWHDKGIVVIGYRPPTTPAMLAVEAEHSGFDEADFAQRFRAAGGLWVEPGTGYETYDGSHLTPESTEKLSGFLAKTLAQALPSQKN